MRFVTLRRPRGPGGALRVAGLVAALFNGMGVSAQEGPREHVVDIRSFAFAPATITVRQGETIAWLNHDIAPHTATANGFDTGAIARDGTASLRFETPGRYAYRCAYHPRMTGEIVVEAID